MRNCILVFVYMVTRLTSRRILTPNPLSQVECKNLSCRPIHCPKLSVRTFQNQYNSTVVGSRGSRVSELSLYCCKVLKYHNLYCCTSKALQVLIFDIIIIVLTNTHGRHHHILQVLVMVPAYSTTIIMELYDYKYNTINTTRTTVVLPRSRPTILPKSRPFFEACDVQPGHGCERNLYILRTCERTDTLFDILLYSYHPFLYHTGTSTLE